MGRETDKCYQEEFRDTFEMLFRAAEMQQQEFEGWEPLNFANPADMAAIQKCLGLGGACKVKTYFCYCCSLTSSNCSVPNKGMAVCTKCRTKQLIDPT